MFHWHIKSFTGAAPNSPPGRVRKGVPLRDGGHARPIYSRGSRQDLPAGGSGQVCEYPGKPFKNTGCEMLRVFWLGKRKHFERLPGKPQCFTIRNFLVGRGQIYTLNCHISIWHWAKCEETPGISCFQPRALRPRLLLWPGVLPDAEDTLARHLPGHGGGLPVLQGISVEGAGVA